MTELDYFKGTAKLLIEHSRDSDPTNARITMPAVDAMELGLRLAFFISDLEEALEE